MECVVTFLILFAAFLFITGSATHAHSQRVRRRFLYENLARRYAGSYVPGGFWRSPTLRLRYGDTRASLREVTDGCPFPGRSTEIVIDWPELDFRCEILPRSLGQRASMLYFLAEVPSGDSDFDSRFVIHAMDASAAERVIRDGVRWQVRQISQLFSGNSVYVLIQSGQITVRKPEVLRRHEELQTFVERTLELYDQLMLTRASGIEFLETDQAQTLEDVVCPVCGETVRKQLVFCRRCKTPHHADCWEFVGACSVYGCGEKRYLRPQAARAATSPDAVCNGNQAEPDPQQGIRPA